MLIMNRKCKDFRGKKQNCYQREKSWIIKTTMNSLKPKFNFFIAFQVNDVGIHQKVKKLQEKVVLKNPLLFPALVKVPTLHVTLAVTHLANDTDIKTVKGKLDDWAEKNAKMYFEEPCVLSFNKVKTFKSGVAYIDIEKCENYKKIVDISESIKNILFSSGFSIDKNVSAPHLTFLKLSKDYRLLKKKKAFKEDFDSFNECKEYFGTQEVNHLQLLSMNDLKDESGYYKCYHEILINASHAKREMDHSECCSPIEISENTS